MDLIALIKGIIRLFPKPPVHTKSEKRDLEKRIVSRYAQGNISLQNGRYLTQEDIDNKKKKALSYTF